MDDGLGHPVNVCALLPVATVASVSGGPFNVAKEADTAGTSDKQISGLGDKANSSLLGLDALFGNVRITVTNLQSDAAAATLIRTLQPKL